MTKLEIERVRTKVRRANARLRALEARDMDMTSSAYRLAEAFSQGNINPNYTPTMKGGINERGEYEKLAFRTDIATIARKDPEAFNVLNAQVDIFLKSESSQVRNILNREQMKQEDYNKLTTSKAFETFNTNRKNRGLKELTYDEYERLWDTALGEYLEGRFSSSEEMVDVMSDIISDENIDSNLVFKYLESLSPDEEANYTRLLDYSKKGTPDEEFERVNYRRNMFL